MRIIFTSDTHGHLYPINYAKDCPENAGLFCVASQIEKDGNTLVLDGGDSLQGTPLVSYYIQHMEEYDFNPVAEGFNEMKLDYYTLGNHDFNFGYDVILDYARSMNAELICANVEDLRGELGIKKSIVRKMPDGTRVGITAAVTDYVNVWEQKENLKELLVTDSVEALKKELNELKKISDFTICIYHGGFEEDLETGRSLSDSIENRACLIARELDFDLLLAGHQHMAVEGTMLAGTYCIQPPDKAMRYCEVDISRNQNGWEFSSAIIDVHEPDEKYREIENRHAFMRDLNGRIENWLDEPIGCLEKAIPPEGKLEAALDGSKVAAIFNQVLLEHTGADFSCASLFNEPLGLNREITVRDVLGIYQFANTIEVKAMTGAALREALERCAEYYDYDEETGTISVSTAFLQPKVEHYNYDFYAGMWYVFDVSKPVGKRVVTLKKLDGEDIKDDTEYTLATSNYRATGTGGYESIGKSRTIRSYSDEMPDLLIDFIKRNSPVKEIINSRFKVMSANGDDCAGVDNF